MEEGAPIRSTVNGGAAAVAVRGAELPSPAIASDAQAKDLSPAAYLILGMLSVGARTGYDVKRTVEVSTRHFSTISQAQIYPLLKRLEAAGLVTAKDESQGNRRRRAHEVTDEGRAALREWLTRDEPVTLEVRHLGMLKMFFADSIDPPEALHIVRSIRKRSERGLAELRHESEPLARAMEQAGSRFPLLTMRLGVALHEAQIECCREIEAELGAELAVSDRQRPAKARG